MISRGNDSRVLLQEKVLYFSKNRRVESAIIFSSSSFSFIYLLFPYLFIFFHMYRIPSLCEIFFRLKLKTRYYFDVAFRIVDS